MNVRLTVSAALAIVSLASTAAAQQAWLDDRRYGEGIGIKTGNFEWHPSLAAEFGYDSNFFQRAENELTGVQDAWRLRVTPSFSLSTLSERRAGSAAVGAPPMLELDANAFLSYSEIFGGEEVSDQRNFTAGVGGKIEVAPQRPFGADLTVDYLRAGEPSNSPVLDQAFDRGTVTVGPGISWRPGGGLLDWRLGYQFAYNYFEEEPYQPLNNYQHSVVTRGRWRFLPRTALRYDARYTMVRYQTERSPQPNGDYLEARVGLGGLVTSQLAFMGMIGWNSSFYEQSNAVTASDVENYDGYVAQVELKWFTSPTANPDSVPVGLSSIAAGFIRDFSNSYLGAFYVRDRGYLGVNYFLGGVFLAELEGGFSRYSFPDSEYTDGSFTQGRMDVELFGEYRLSDTFGINLSVLYDQAFTPSEPVGEQGVLVEENPDGDDATADDAYDDLRYSRFQAYVGLRLFW